MNDELVLQGMKQWAEDHLRLQGHSPSGVWTRGPLTHGRYESSCAQCGDETYINLATRIAHPDRNGITGLALITTCHIKVPGVDVRTAPLTDEVMDRYYV